MRHLRNLFGCNGTSAVTTEAPQWHHRQQGRIPDRANRPLPRHGDSDALFAAEVHSFLRCKISANRPAFATRLWIQKFESFRSNQAVQPWGCHFRAKANRRHFRWLGWRAPVSACNFLISVSAWRRPVQFFMETGSHGAHRGAARDSGSVSVCPLRETCVLMTEISAFLGVRPRAGPPRNSLQTRVESSGLPKTRCRLRIDLEPASIWGMSVQKEPT